MSAGVFHSRVVSAASPPTPLGVYSVPQPPSWLAGFKGTASHQDKGERMERRGVMGKEEMGMAGDKKGKEAGREGRLESKKCMGTWLDPSFTNSCI